MHTVCTQMCTPYVRYIVIDWNRLHVVRGTDFLIYCTSQCSVLMLHQADDEGNEGTNGLREGHAVGDDSME